MFEKAAGLEPCKVSMLLIEGAVVDTNYFPLAFLKSIEGLLDQEVVESWLNC